MKLLLVIAALLAVVYSEECNKLQRLMVKQIWTSQYATGEGRLEFNAHLWEDFFKRKPDAVALFDRVRGDNMFSSEFRAHMARVDSGLDLVLSSLDDQDILDAQLAHLNTQHKELGVGADMFNAFAKSVLHVIGDGYGMCFDQDAWKGCLDLIVAGIVA